MESTTTMPLVTEWRDRSRQRANIKDFIRSQDDDLWCDVVTIKPKLRLPWAYNDEQEEEGDVWECSAVWLHHGGLPNGHVYDAVLHEDLRIAINALNLTLPNGRMFTLSVWKIAPNKKALLAVAWN
jgi:hypothetical protein